MVHVVRGTSPVWMALLLGAAACGEEALPSDPGGPTWFRDVEPIVAAECSGCHVEGGIAPFAITTDNAQGLAPTLAAAVADRTMPPWPPGADGLPIVGSRALGQEQIDTLVSWSAAGAPLGRPEDHRDVTPEVTFDPGRDPDLTISLAGDNVYVPPDGAAGSDEVRCFVLDLPAGTPNVWITALRWVPGQPAAVHHIGGAAVDVASAALARSWYGADGRAGYDCAGGLGNGLKGTAGLGSSGAGADTGTMLPEGTGIFVPAASSLVVTIHYVVEKVSGVDDASGVELWFAREEEKMGLRPMVQYTFNAPSELPCPEGVSEDPDDPCSRQWAIDNSPSTDGPEKIRATNDYLLARCGMTLDAYYAQLSFDDGDAAHFTIPTECIEASRFEGVIHLVRNHMHTRGSSSYIELEQADGQWLRLLDIPRWDWHWEATYLLEDGVALSAEQRLRVGCEYDNGTENQWSMTTGEPGGPKPLEWPTYVVAASAKKADMCGGDVTLEIPPYRGESYEDVCHEIQARYDDACVGGTADFTSLPCSDALEALAVLMLQIPVDLFESFACAPRGPGAEDGAACSDAMSCALACGAVTGFDDGLTAACIDACKADVSAYGMAPAGPASPLGAFQLDQLVACGNAHCGDRTDWQSYLECTGVWCTELTKACFPMPTP